MSVLEAQAALDDWVRDYNAERPHQALEHQRAGHAGRALPARAGRAARAAAAVAARAAGGGPAAGGQRDASSARSTPAPTRRPLEGGPVEFDRVVPASGNLMVCQRQFWLGPARAGQTVRFWASVDVIHLTIAGARVKSLRSHSQHRRPRPAAAPRAPSPAGPPPLPPVEPTAPRSRSTARSTTAASSALAGKQILAAEILGGRPVIVRVEAQTLMFLDPDTRELLRVRPNPLTREQALRLQGARPAGPPPRPADRARHRATARQRHRRDHRLPPTRRARPRPRRPHGPRSRLRAHARGRARRRDAHDPPHHHPTGRRRQGQPPTPTARRDNVNGTLRRARIKTRHDPDFKKQQKDPYET